MSDIRRAWADADDPLRSGQGFQPNAWGPPLWFFLHTISLNYPILPTPDQQREYYYFFKTLGFVLPCKHCRDAYTTMTKDLDLGVFRTRKSLTRWVYDLHNLVNTKLGKKTHIPSFNSVLRYYHGFRGGQPQKHITLQHNM